MAEGTKIIVGTKGDSAADVARQNGFVGTDAEYAAFLQGGAMAAQGYAADAKVQRQAAEAAVGRAEAPTDAMNANLLNTKGTATEMAMSSATIERLYVGETAKPRIPTVEKMLERFQTGHGWGAFASTPPAALGDDTSDFALGNQSYSFTTGTVNTPATVQKTTYALDITDLQIMLWVKVIGSTNLTELIFYAGDVGLANHYSWTIGDTGGREQQVWREDQWTPLVLSFADAGKVNSPNRANIATFRVRARSVTGKSITIKLGGIGATPEPNVFPKGVISIGCDDSYLSQYTILRPALDKYGWNATAYTIVELLGRPNFMNIDHLKDLENSHGWEVAGHAFKNDMHSDGYGSGSTHEAIEEDISQLRNWLLKNKFRGADHLAYPRGYYAADTTPIIGKYFATGRTVINRMTETIRPSDRMRLRSMSVSSGTTLANAKAYVDRVKTGKAWGIITIHDLIETPTAGTQWPTADLLALLAYISEQDIPVMNLSEVVGRLSAPDAAKASAAETEAANATIGAIVHAALGNIPGRLFALSREQAVGGVSAASGRADVITFSTAVNMPVSRLTVRTSGTAWAGHTLARMGLYTADPAGNLVLVARTDSDPTLFVAANTSYQRELSPAGGYPASYNLIAGRRYALAILGVGQSAGQLRGNSAILTERWPVMGGTLGTGLTDLPTSGVIVASGSYPWAELAS